MTESFINEAELLLFTRNTARLIKKLMDMHFKGKVSKEQLKEKLLLLKESLKKKFAALEQNDGLKPIDNLDYAIQEYLEQNDIYIYEQRIPYFEKLKQKEENIRKNDLEELQIFCEANKVLLKELKSDLMENLKVRIFIIHCCNKEYSEAIQFVRAKQISVDIMREWLFLLVRDYNLHMSKINEHLNNLVNEYKRILCHIKGLPSQTRLTNRIVAGIIALNSIDCLNKRRVDDCPTCLPWIQSLAAKLPYSRRTNTFLRCKGSNEEINESNRPLVYETRHIYSEKYLKTCGYVVYCAETKKYCDKKPEICFFL
ncbi:hypothetical protein THOM_2316 [Trachipleistophora hominis]|uniref:Uncharacterized protein n=1 Tax=Trachipleistophora hominis TaxID=72359 RepID=L7JTX8_TRAHO|nr:hypothetical protein THOM_2316 [Trachipleistophora hominis]